jgi:hypothetical protein
MKPTDVGALAVGAALAAAALPALARANELAIDIAASADNPSSPRMGDQMSLQTQIRNTGTAPVDGIVAWLSLVRVDPGMEHPVSLEDWSAEKAVTVDRLAPGEVINTDWPMRLIQDGHYRVVVSATSRDGHDLAASPFADFVVRVKPVVESRRVLPVAVGMPALLLLVFFFHRRRSARA